MEQLIYLDYAATTPVAEEVFDAMLPYLRNRFANPSSTHVLGREVEQVMENARILILGKLGGKDGQLFFTGSATESINTILKSYMPLQNREKVPHIVTSCIEHKAVLSTCSYLERCGVGLTHLSVSPDGLVDPDQLRKAITQETNLVCIQWVNNEIGSVQQIAEIGRICKEHKVLFMVDAVQAAGKLPIDVAGCHIDFLIISAHKFCGPKGVAAHFVSEKGMQFIKPLLHGGGQEDGMRGGTHNVAGIIGMARALEIACMHMDAEWERLSFIMAEFLAKLQRQTHGVAVNALSAPRVPGILNLRIEDVENNLLMRGLDDLLAVSAGSACLNSGNSVSYVLRAIGLGDECVSNSIRISVGRFTTVEQLLFAADAISKQTSIIRNLK